MPVLRWGVSAAVSTGIAAFNTAAAVVNDTVETLGDLVAEAKTELAP